MDAICPDCGRPLDSHDQHIRFALPDSVIAAGLTANSADVWIGGETARKADFMAAKDIGHFVRCLVEVQLTDGYSVTYGVWILADEPVVRHAHSEWNADTYMDLVIEGQLANNLGPWEVSGAQVIARPRDPNGIPFVESSTDAEMRAVLADIWPHELVLATLPTQAGRAATAR